MDLSKEFAQADLSKATVSYRQALARSRRARAELHTMIREAFAAGLTQAEIVRVTGYTRETIRQISRQHEAAPEDR